MERCSLATQVVAPAGHRAPGRDWHHSGSRIHAQRLAHERRGLSVAHRQPAAPRTHHPGDGLKTCVRLGTPATRTGFETTRRGSYPCREGDLDPGAVRLHGRRCHERGDGRTRHAARDLRRSDQQASPSQYVFPWAPVYDHPIMTGGAAVTALFKEPELFATYSIGLAVGFFAYLIVGLALDARAKESGDNAGVGGWMGPQ